MSKVYTDNIEKRTGGAAIAVPASGQWIDLASAAQGDVLYHNGTSYVRLAPGTSGQYLQTAGAGANPAWASVVGGLSVAQTFRENADHVNGSTSIVIGAANFEEADQAGYTALPTSGGITQSSGVFTFPSTGRYLVLSSVRSSQGVTAYSYTNIQYSSDSGSTWTTQSQGVMMYHVIATYADNQCHAVVNINDESTDRVRVTFDSSSTSITVYGDTNFNETYITLIKLA